MFLQLLKEFEDLDKLCVLAFHTQMKTSMRKSNRTSHSHSVAHKNLALTLQSPVNVSVNPVRGFENPVTLSFQHTFVCSRLV